MKWVEHVAHMEKMRNTYRILIGKPEWEMTTWETPRPDWRLTLK
jgi:hypothetical protein